MSDWTAFRMDVPLPNGFSRLSPEQVAWHPVFRSFAAEQHGRCVTRSEQIVRRFYQRLWDAYPVGDRSNWILEKRGVGM